MRSGAGPAGGFACICLVRIHTANTQRCLTSSRILPMAFWANLWYHVTHYLPRRALRVIRWRNNGIKYKVSLFLTLSIQCKLKAMQVHRAGKKLIKYRRNVSGSIRISVSVARRRATRRLYSRATSSLPKSPVPKSLLRSNGIPTDEQASKIHAHVLKVKTLQEETLALRDPVSASRLTAREKTVKEALERQVDEHRALVSPFRRLPLEIL